MKQLSVILLFVFLLFGCKHDSESTTFENTYLGTWKYVAHQAPGIGPPGVWSNIPPGQYMTLDANGKIGGNVFTDVTRYQLVDSNTVKFIAPSQPAGFYLFNYRVDTIARNLLLYVRPPDGVSLCFEGCGTYKFER